NIVCVSRNYREHAAQLGHDVPIEPLIFLNPPSALLAPGGQIRRPKISERVDHEGELGVVVAKTCNKVRPDEDVRPYILGYTCVDDVTARDRRKKTASGPEPRVLIRSARLAPWFPMKSTHGPAPWWRPA